MVLPFIAGTGQAIGAVGAGLGLAGRFAAQYGARQIAARQAASAAAAGGGRSLLRSIPRLAAGGALLGGAAQVASNLVRPSPSSPSEVESDNSAALASSEEIATPQAQTSTTEIASIAPSEDGDIGGKLSDSPIIALLRSIDASMKELKDALVRRPSEQSMGGSSGVSGLMGPRAAGISGSLLLALAPAIDDFFSRIGQNFNQGAENRQSANEQAAENRSNMPPRQAAGAANPGQQGARNIQLNYNIPSNEIARIQDTLSTPEVGETPEQAQVRESIRQDFDRDSRAAGARGPTMTPALSNYLNERERRETVAMASQEPWSTTGTPGAMTPEETQASRQRIERMINAEAQSTGQLNREAQQQDRQRIAEQQAATFDEEERRQAERAAARGPGVAARTISAITGLFSPRAFTQPASQRAADMQASRAAADAEAQTLFSQGGVEPVSSSEQNIRALNAPAAQPQPVVINATGPGAAPVPVSAPGAGMQTQGGGLTPPGSTPPRVDAAHPEMVSQSPAMGRGYGP